MNRCKSRAMVCKVKVTSADALLTKFSSGVVQSAVSVVSSICRPSRSTVIASTAGSVADAPAQVVNCVVVGTSHAGVV